MKEPAMLQRLAGEGTPRPRLDVTVVLLDDGHASTGIVPVEVFDAAGALWQALRGEQGAPAFRVRGVSLDGGPVRSPYGLEIVPQGSIDDVARTDVVVVASSGLEIDLKLVENSAILPWLRRHYAQGALVAGACVGAAYLAEAGLLDGRLATSHWALCDRLAARYPNVKWRPDLFVTEDSRLYCSGGVYAAIDVSLYLVEKLCGHEVAVQCAKALLLPMPRISQTGYSVTPIARSHDDADIRTVEAYLQDHLGETISTQRLAAAAGMTVRTFARRFKAATGKMPASYLQALRIASAKALLERGEGPVQRVSQKVGYDDVAFFRSLFKRETGMTPGEYRAQFAPIRIAGEAVLEGA
jgi:transcriptional regulator GlxA family with amidase domain